jgi:uncharacterized protein with NAD-binding domain and iron-sulfur cluster
MGHRLGGKGTTGRGPQGRIEERGIHILQGWYNNTFRMVRDAYDHVAERNLAPKSPYKRWQDAILPDKSTLFTQQEPDTHEWSNWAVTFPFNAKVPGEGGPISLRDTARTVVGFALTLVFDSPYLRQENPRLAALAKKIDAEVVQPKTPEREQKSAPGLLAGTRAERAIEVAGLRAADAVLQTAARVLRKSKNKSRSLRRARIAIEFAAANVRGMVRT